MSREKVTRIPVRHRPPPDTDRELVPFAMQLDPKPCDHPGPYLVDEPLAEVECGRCGQKLNPIWVLFRLAQNEERRERKRKAVQEEMARLSERKRTKCQHCQRMTRISPR